MSRIKRCRLTPLRGPAQSCVVALGDNNARFVGIRIDSGWKELALSVAKVPVRR
jgi:hypothetical protein